MAGAATYLVTGASRGLGFEFVKQLLEGDASVVIAGVRNPETAGQLTEYAAKHPGRLHVVKLDVADPASIKTLRNEEAVQAAFVEAAKLLPSGLDYLICNAGIGSSFCKASEDKWDDIDAVFKTNVLGVIATIQEALPLLREGTKKTIITISSMMGSLTIMSSSTDSGPMSIGAMGYKASKAALNMATTTFAAELRGEGFTLVALHPGWVSTDMGNGAATLLKSSPPVEPYDSVAGMIKVIEALTPEKTGAFISWEGTTVPW